MTAAAPPRVRRDRDEIARLLEAARARTLALLAPLDEAALRRQDDPLQSPLVWDLAHIGAYEELWLLRPDGELDARYDASRQPRAGRGRLELLTPAEARAYLAEVRSRVLDRLERVDLDGDDPLDRDGFAFGLVIQHELQHVETMTQTLQLSGHPYPGELGSPGTAGADGWRRLAEGWHAIGALGEPWAYDNERDAHVVELPAFEIGAAPVTNAAFAAYVADGGEPPLHWRDDGELRFGRLVERAPEAPVCHVSHRQAEGFAAWAGARLPREAEWEAAARSGALAGVGRVWEWTSSDFRPYPGFRAFPYPEYSEVFFGPDYRVLRGGSWVTDPLVARPSFRNWDLPERRQIFAGFRLARDV